MPETDPASSEEPALSEEPVPPEEPGVPEERSSLAGLDWWRGARWFGAEYLIVVLGVLTAQVAADSLVENWPLSQAATLGILLVGASVPAGAFVQGLGGWKKRGILFAAGFLGFAIGSYLL